MNEKKIKLKRFFELMVEGANNATPFILFTAASIVLYDKKPILDSISTLIVGNCILWLVWIVPTINKIKLEDDDKITRIVFFISILCLIFMLLIATIRLS